MRKAIAAIIPVVNPLLFKVLFKQILQNTETPFIIFIIDNTRIDLTDYIASFVPSTWMGRIISYKPPRVILGTNEAWNLGIDNLPESNKDYIVSFLNDDISIKKDFFERIITAFELNEDAGAICPYTITTRRPLIPESNNKYIRMVRREGWAFSILKSIIDKSPRIPLGCKYFFGDNWYWWMTYRKHQKIWKLDVQNIIFHHVGKSVIELPNKALIQKQEKKICEEALARLFPKKKKPDTEISK